MSAAPWVCDQGDDTFDHDWRVCSDSDYAGRWYWRECRECGEEDRETPVEPPTFEDFDYFAD